MPSERQQAAPKPAAEKAAKPQAPKPAPPPAEEPPQAYLDAVARLQDENPAIRVPLDSMRFIRFDGSQVHVEFSRKVMMHMKLLERRKELINAAMSEAFGAPVSVAMRPEGSGAPEKSVSDAARDAINQSYDVFGRDKVEFVD